MKEGSHAVCTSKPPTARSSAVCLECADCLVTHPKLATRMRDAEIVPAAGRTLNDHGVASSQPALDPGHASPTSLHSKAWTKLKQLYGTASDWKDAALRYSPFAFASQELESAFQAELPERVRAVVTAWAWTRYLLTLAVTSRMLRHLEGPLHNFPLNFWVPLLLTVTYSIQLGVTVKYPHAFRKHWIFCTVLIRTEILATVFATWELFPPEPIPGPLSFAKAAYILIMVCANPVTFASPCGAPMPLLLHIGLQLLVLANLYRIDPQLCSDKLASPDLPAHMEGISYYMAAVAPWMADLLTDFPDLRCEFALSLAQTIGTLFGIVLIAGSEIGMRRAFLESNSTAQRLLRRYPVGFIKSFPFGKAQGIRRCLPLAVATVFVTLLTWQLFVLVLVSQAASGAPMA